MTEQSQPSTTYVRLIAAVAMSAVAAWTVVTYFNHGTPRRNVTPRGMPLNFGLAPPGPATAPMPKSWLPAIASARKGVGLSWDGVDGLRVNRLDLATLVPGQHPVVLAAAATEGMHRVGMAFSGLAPNRDYRVTAWMKVGSLNRMFLDVRDGGKMYAGTVAFNLSPPAVAATSGGLFGAKIEPASDAWFKTSVDLHSNDGVIVVYVGQMLQDGSTQFHGALTMTLMLGGVEVQPIR